MRVSRTHWFVRVARFGRSPYWYPRSLCSLFWNFVWTVVTTAVAVGLVGLLLYAAVTQPQRFFGTIAGAVILMVIIWLLTTKMPKAVTAVTDTLPWQAAKSIKGKVCPIIEWRNDAEV